MSDAVTIRRCVLRIRRHGGWSWGPDPDALLGAATRALPRLIAKHVQRSGAVIADRDVHIAAPVRLHVRATVEELVALAASVRTGDEELAAPPALAQRIDEAFTQALGAVSVESHAPVPAAPVAADEPRALRVVAPSLERAVLAMLMRWQRDRVLMELLAAMPAIVRERWLAVIAARLPIEHVLELGAREARSVEAARAVAAQLAGGCDATVVALAAIAAAIACEPVADEAAVDDGRIVRAVLAAVPVVRDGVAAMRADRGDPTSPVTAGSERETRSAAPAATPQTAREQPVTTLAPFVTSALPFLALVPLARCGWLEASAAILDGAGRAAHAPALVAALAYKLLPPPEHAWLRTPAQRDTAAVLAGRAIEDAALADAEVGLAALADALVAPLTAELRRGHRRGAPLVLVRDGERYALLDTEGMFVLASARELMRVIDAARGLGEVILVPAAEASARVLDAIECANLVFVTDAPPARNAPWRPVPRARLWTNDGGAAERHASLAALVTDASELAGEALAALRARPAVPRSERDVLDRIATHAASLALADLAWNLFRARETPTPMLAIERFASLDAHVTPGEDRIEVRVPLGRRHADLLAHGYLTALALPDGRVLHLMGG